MKYLVFLSLLSFSALQADIIYVNSNATTGGDGTSWETAFNYLQDALDVTVSGRGDQVWIAQGTYYPDDGTNVTEGDRLASFIIKDQVALYGGFIGIETDIAQRNWESNTTILSGEIWEDQVFWTAHVTTIDNNTVSFDGITIIKGNANGQYPLNWESAAVYGEGNVNATNCTFSRNSANGSPVASGSTWTAINCTFSENSSDDSGSIITTGTWTATNCTFSDNSAPYGLSWFGTWIVNNCTFSGNSANRNSGGVSHQGTWTATNCTFSDNSANSFGGVVYGPGGDWTATNCTFSGNSASLGGGVSYRGKFTATNCTFSDNSASKGGVTMYSTLNATNCTFSGNSANYDSGESYSGRGGVAYSGTWTATNCTFSGNSAIGFGGVSYQGTWKIFNNIFYNNSGNGQFYDSTIYPTNETTPNPFTVLAKNLISGGSAAFVDCTIPFSIPEANIIDADPLFVDINDPDGPDDIWGTEDDGFRLQSSSPAISLGDADYLPLDTYDLDGDDDKVESLPVDIADYIRIQDGALDLGAYEFGDQNGLISFFTVSVSTEVGGTVNQDGSTVYYQPVNLSLRATPLEGYVFSRWIGNIEASVENDNPLTLTAINDFSITASFTPDLSDLDFDGLTLYEEKVTYKTNPNTDDTSGDGLKDGVVVSAGFDPTVDYSNLVNASRQGMTDLRAGSTIVEVLDNEATIQLKMEESSDIESGSWTEVEGSATMTVPVPTDSDTKFYRFKLDD